MSNMRFNLESGSRWTHRLIGHAKHSMNSNTSGFSSRAKNNSIQRV